MTIRTTLPLTSRCLHFGFLALTVSLVAASTEASESDRAHGWSPLDPIRARVAIVCESATTPTEVSGILTSVTAYRGGGPSPLDPAEARGILEAVVCDRAQTIRFSRTDTVPPAALNRSREEACGDTLAEHVAVGGYVPYSPVVGVDLNDDGRTDYVTPRLCNIPGSSTDFEVYIAEGAAFRRVERTIAKHFVVLESSTLGHRDLAFGSFHLPDPERTYTLLRWDGTSYRRYADITYWRPFRSR